MIKTTPFEMVFIIRDMMKGQYPDAARVWQRVLPSEPREQQTLQMLIQQLSLDMAVLKQLAKTGETPLLGLLIREYSGQLHCLRGILMLSGGSLPRNAAGHRTDFGLSRCFEHALQRLGAYRLRSADPVYGPVFQDLSHQTEHHCRCLTELLGMAKGEV